MNYKLILTFIFGLIFNYSFACTCAPPRKLKEARKNELANSDIVLLGSIVELNEKEQKFTLVIMEVFKGTVKELDTLIFNNNYNCPPIVGSLGEWLIYGKKENLNYEINICGLSRSIDMPETNRYFNPMPPPPHPNSEITEVECDIIFKETLNRNRDFAQKELEIELSWLRQANEN
jgi:hypothetical protein